MNEIDHLDKVLEYVNLFSKNLASIPETELSINSGIELDELYGYLAELERRGYVSNHDNGTYITLQGRLALQNAQNGKPFKEEVKNKKLKKYWSITKIIAGVLNALAIIAIAIWTQVGSDNSSKLENKIEKLKTEHKSQKIIHSKKIDSLNKLINDFRKENADLTKQLETKIETKEKK